MKTMAIGAAILAIGGAIAGPDALDSLRGFDPELAARARVPVDQARGTALALFLGGRILEEELEDEGGTLMYSFEIEPALTADVMEVEVDAITGEVLRVVHEDDEGGELDEGDDDDGARGDF